MLELKVKYFSEDVPRLQPSIKEDGNEWIDVYAAEDITLELGERKLIPLGFALEMPKGYEAILAPRSSTNATWGIIFVNSFGVIDNKYKGNKDEWRINAMFINPNCKNVFEMSKPIDGEHSINVTATKISKGDKIGQFRIQECMPDVKFVEVDNLDNEDRGGFGSTGTTGYKN